MVEFGQSRMVGEVKYLERGKLYFKSDATGTIAIDWADVTVLVTASNLRMEERDGRIAFGSLAPGAAPAHLLVVGEGEVHERSTGEIVAFEPIETGFLERLDVDLSVGYSLAKSTEVEQLDLAANIEFDTEENSRRLSLLAQSSDSQAGVRSSRRNLEYLSLRRKNAPFIWGWMGNFEDNDALDLDFRVLGALVAGRDFYPTPNRRFRSIAGIAVSQEGFDDGKEQTSTELLIGGLLDWYRFRSPELDLSSSLIVYPSLTEAGRWRSRFDVTLRWEIYDDLFWRLSFYDDYDSDSPEDSGTGGSSLNDFGISTGLGWNW
ncbi:MAG: DUF481 domain-containing protein [Pseudomonadales bacterium]